MFSLNDIEALAQTEHEWIFGTDLKPGEIKVITGYELKKDNFYVQVNGSWQWQMREGCCKSDFQVSCKIGWKF